MNNRLDLEGDGLPHTAWVSVTPLRIQAPAPVDFFPIYWAAFAGILFAALLVPSLGSSS